MQNPVKQAREQLGLTLKEFASVCGVVEVTVRANEKGSTRSITPKILSFLVKQGFHEQLLKAEYEKYLEWRAKQVMKELSAAR